MRLKKQKWNKKDRIDLYDIDFVLNSIYQNQTFNFRILLDSRIVKIRWLKMATFKKSIICPACKLKGKYFALEKDINNEDEIYHFSLYGVRTKRSRQKEVYMNIDHIKAKSKGGKNTLDNFQVMCYECNIKKGCK